MEGTLRITVLNGSVGGYNTPLTAGEFAYTLQDAGGREREIDRWREREREIERER